MCSLHFGLMLFAWVDTTLPMSVSLQQSSGAPLVHSQPYFIQLSWLGNFNSHHSAIQTGHIRILTRMGSCYRTGRQKMTSCCYMTSSNVARWERDFSPDPCWIFIFHARRSLTACFVHGPRRLTTQHRPLVIDIGFQLPVVGGV